MFFPNTNLVTKRFLFISILLFVPFVIRAQYDASFSHYFDMEPSFNPAAVGKQSKLNVTAAYALDMAGFEHNPRTLYLGADLPFNIIRSRHGTGVQLMNDQIGLFTHQRLSLQYAYKIPLLKGIFSLGVQGGFISESFDGSKVDAGESGDPALPTADVNGSGIDLGLGFYYLRHDWYVGLSALHLNAPTIELGENNELKIDAVYYFTGGYNIRLRNPFLTIKPSVLVKCDGSTWRGDLTGRLVYQYNRRMLYGGMSYSPDHSLTFLLGGSFHGLVLGYSYEVYTSKLGVGNGSHEFFVGYQTGLNFSKKGKSRHQSVRIL